MAEFPNRHFGRWISQAMQVWSSRDKELLRAERHYIFKTAKVSLPSGGIVEVMVKNLSSSGASIEFRGAVLPQKLLIMEPSLNLHRWAEVVWQRAGHAGLRFVADEGVRAAPTPATQSTAANKALVRSKIRKPKTFG